MLKRKQLRLKESHKKKSGLNRKLKKINLLRRRLMLIDLP